MPIIDKGTHQCDKCCRVFEWIDFELIKNRMSQSRFQAERIPDSHLLVRKYLGADGKPVYRKNCPYCDYDNQFGGSEQNGVV